MRKFEDKGRQYKVTERDYKKLLAKLDTSKARLSEYGEYRIDNSCVCPGRHTDYCSTCSLGPMRYNCIKLLTTVAGMRRPEGMEFCLDYLTWPVGSKKAVEYLDAARQKLLELPRVR